MSFYSKHASGIWDDLYTVMVPDQVTLNPDYVRKFGVHISGNKEVDAMLSNSYTTVKIPIADILNYFDEGVQVQIPDRADMIAMHKAIEAYLSEWYEHVKYSINHQGDKHKAMLLNLEKLSKHIYAKAYASEVVQDVMAGISLGLPNPLAILAPKREMSKPNYQGIGELLRPKRTTSRFS